MKVLVLGYGNVLRADDGVGRHVADRLAEGPLPSGTAVRACHQLTPELAEDVAAVDRVVFVDGDLRVAPGRVATSRVLPQPGSPAWSHHLSMPALLGLAERVYGRAPAGYAVSVGIESIEPGDRLSLTVKRALPAALDAVLAIVEDRSLTTERIPAR